MTIETANSLLEVLITALNTANENKIKLLALEKTLEGSERALYLAYSTHLEDLRRNSSTSPPLQELANLRAKLVQG
jgi:hypothetical protein